MALQQYRFKFLTALKNLVIGVLAIGFILSLRSLLDVNAAKRIETMNAPQFRNFVDNYNYKSASLRSLQTVAKKALDLTPQDVKASQNANDEILSKKINCLHCQNRIVFYELLENDALTETALNALTASYDLSPYGDTELMKWRLEVSSHYWNELNEDLRNSSLTQITALSQYRNGRLWLREFDTDVDSINSRVMRVAN